LENRNLKKDLKQLDTILKEQGISRRDAMKMMGLGGASVFMLEGTDAQAATSLNASDAKGKIVIVGGGLSGMATAARLSHSLANPDITIIEPEANSCSYQSGQTLVGAGLWDKKDILYKRDDFLPKGVNILAYKAIDFNPHNNTITTDLGDTISYDFLVVAAGVKLNYGAIRGLEEVHEVYSSGKNKKLVDVLNSVGASSIYTADSAVATWENMKKFVKSAKKGKKVNGLFTHPNTPIKCGGAPKKIMYLMNSRLEEAGLNTRSNANLHFYPDGGAMFGIKSYNDAIVKQFDARNMNYSYNHNLIKVKKGIATFNYRQEVKGDWDPDLEEYTMTTTHTQVEKEFDFLHITPPMKAPDEIAQSAIGSPKGWVPVDKKTLQHIKYKNIFALGDIAAVPMAKTGGSARKQYKIVVDNLIALMEGKELPSKYDGYTACPLITSIGTVMLAEFNWASRATGNGSNAALIPMLDSTKERYIWWLLEFYLLKPMTVYGMLSGRV